jgi:hypothetical protein
MEPDDFVFELHWEVTREHEVRDERSRLKGLPCFVSDHLGIGDPPSRAERATVDQITTVRVLSLPIRKNLPNRRLVRVVRRPTRSESECPVDSVLLDQL